MPAIASSGPPARRAQADDERTCAALYGSNVSGSPAPRVFRCVYDAIGLPRHQYGLVGCPSLESEPNAWSDALKQPDTLGTCITMPLKLPAYDRVDELTEEALVTGCINTTFFRPSDPSDPLSPPLVVGTNTDTPACLSVLLSSFLSLPSPFPPSAPRAFSPAAKAAALAVGGGGATRAAVHALQQLGCAPIYVVNRDEGETEAMRAHFAKWRWDVRALRSVGDAERELEGLEKDGGRVVCGVGAIPCAEPTTDGERMVYDVAEAVFARRYERRAGEAEDEGTLRLPERPVFVDMAYKPPMTRLRVKAEEHGWKSLCGTEVVLENCFAQCHLWTAIEVPADVRQKARELLEQEQ
ncbi:hypothetical protein DMC30DRAFT_447655 [Rhodotorula diobovata]|uniref:Shikimate dehydrogenase substrate binding N-terminal domain-containing protein n=1 Tax=Rhodotorula diobovata TaxID=5288 RepID=A0A5C5FTX1_9BASI|nr:hypothetical protein DMC30DRAFT_447655 [Rhodotorula diobovata]